jgi:hypothetical protein
MSDFVYNLHLMPRFARKWLVPALIGLCVGGLVLPALIYGAGVAALGRYEGGSLGNIYKAVLGGLTHGSISSWVVLLGPYALWQLGRLLLFWWRASATGA